jgi:DNA-binding XRE family transcriptional regulator
MAEHANVYPLRREPQREPRPQERLTRERQPQEPLWREVLGRRLRVLRQEQQETLSETAARAGISPQYLSEIERGRKEPSSEMIAALAGALGTTLIDLTEHVAGDLRRQMSLAPRASHTRPGHIRPGHTRPGGTRPGGTRPGGTRPGDVLALAA